MIGNHPIPGARCWANFCGSYGLPDGLEDRTPLVVVAWSEFTGTALDAGGKLWSLNRVQIDTGFSYYLDGLLCLEDSPTAVEYLRHVVRRLKAKLASTGGAGRYDRHNLEEKLSRARWYLERNGNDTDVPPSGPAPRLAGGSPPSTQPNPRLPVRQGQSEPRRMRS